MADTQVQVIELEGTRVDTLWTTVESGKLDDGTKYEKRQRTAPRTFEEAVQDENGTLLKTKLKAMQTQLNGVSTEIGTTIDEAITQRAGVDIANKEDLTVLKIQGTILSTEDEINTFYDTYSNNYGYDTWYRTVVTHGVSHSILSGGRFYLEGFKTTDEYEWQKVTSYCDNSGIIRCFTRSKDNGIWKEWRNISDADTLDGKHASDFLPLAGGTVNGEFGVSEIGDNTSKSILVTANLGLTHLVNNDNSNGRRRQITIVPQVRQADPRYALRFDQSDSDVWTNETILHTGLSKPVAIQSTAPTDTSALWYNQSTKTLKSYVDGAWT